LKKTLNLMRRGHVYAIGFDAASIPFILTKLVEVGQTPTGTIDKKAQHLFEELCNWQPLAVLADGTEPAIKPTENLNAMQVSNEQSQARSASQPVGSGIDTSNFQFILSVVFAMLAPRVLYLLGGVILVTTVVGFNNNYNTLANFKGLFSFENRLL